MLQQIQMELNKPHRQGLSTDLRLQHGLQRLPAGTVIANPMDFQLENPLTLGQVAQRLVPQKIYQGWV